ncbi:MAG: hypothetical protein JWO22_886 [Frankiales bacterium]|nr:hypothetical protein [Frankiales bacterium]
MRGVRAAVLTVPTVGLASTAHALVDGCDSALAIALAAGLCWPGAVAVLGARRRLPALLAWVVTAQLVTHVLLDALCGPGIRVPALTWTMGAFHAVAALSTGLLLGRADAGLWAADALLRAGAKALRLRRSLALPLVPAPFRRTAPVPVLLPRSTWVAAQPARRGPPVLLALAQ